MFLKNFHSEEYESYLIVSNQYKEQEERFRPYVKQILYVDMVRNLSLKQDLKGVKELKKIFKQINPDIVYLNSSKAGGLGRLALLFNRKIKIVYNAHGWYFNAKIGTKKQKLYAIIERILAHRTDMIVNISKDEYDTAIARKIAPKEKMCIIENGIDFEKFKEHKKYRNITRKKLNISDDEALIGQVGRLTEQKNPMAVIKTFKFVHEKYPNTKLLFVGSGKLENEVKVYAKENNIEDSVIITGWVNEVEKYIPALDIGLLLSNWERIWISTN